MVPVALLRVDVQLPELGPEGGGALGVGGSRGEAARQELGRREAEELDAGLGWGEGGGWDGGVAGLFFGGVGG